MSGKDKSFITYLGVLKAPANIRLEQEAQPPSLLGGINSRIIPLAEEVGTSPASRGSAVSKALFGEDMAAFRADKECCGCSSSITVLAVQGGLSPGTPLWPHGQQIVIF